MSSKCSANCDFCKYRTFHRCQQVSTVMFDLQAARVGLYDQGFTHFAVTPPAALEGELAALKAFCGSLPGDPNDPTSARRRGYQKFILLPRKSWLQVIESSMYQQDAAFNDEAAGKPRRFASLEGVAGNKFLQAYIVELFETLPVADAYRDRLWDIGVHLIRLQAHPGQQAVASPNHLHRDGEPFTVIHVLHRDNVVGGDTHVACDREGKKMLADFQIAPGAAVVVRDAAVWHHVTPVETAGDGVGVRDVMLIEFTPFRQDFRPLALAR